MSACFNFLKKLRINLNLRTLKNRITLYTLEFITTHVRIHYNFFHGEIDGPITEAHFYDSIRIGRSIVDRVYSAGRLQRDSESLYPSTPPKYLMTDRFFR